MQDINTTDSFHIARSRYFDAMAEFETQVVRVLRLGEVKVGSECLGQKLEKLKSLKASSRLSKEVIAKLGEFAMACGPMLDERNDIVHSAMKMVNLDGVPHGFFTNTRFEQCESSLVGRLVSAVQFQQLERETRNLASKMAQFGRPVAPVKKAPAAADASVVTMRTGT